MQKIFHAAQIKQCDAYTIAHEPIVSVDLMERAARGLCNYIKEHMQASAYAIYCGQGNNGGDGLALARMLHEENKKVSVFIVREKEKGSHDFEINLQRLQAIANISVNFISEVNELETPSNDAVLIDALLGTGINGTPKGLTKDVIHFINKCRHDVIAVDLPSGLLCDAPVTDKSTVVRANITLSFQFYKLAFLLPENDEFIGKTVIIPISLSEQFIQNEASKLFMPDIKSIASMLPKRSKVSHKGNFGHVLLIAGSEGKYGAALLAAKACLRSGVGLLTVHSSNGLETPLNIALPSAMFSSGSNDQYVKNIPDLDKYNSIAIGCGIGTHSDTQKALKLLIQESKIPLILDADALNILSENKTWLSFLPPESILTPHHKEFERLVGKWDNSYERIKLQKEFSLKYHCYIVFKGAYTCISSPSGNCYFNSTGNPGMAKAGSGDTLLGIIAACVANSSSILEACISAVYIHGLAGDMAQERFGERSMLPEDLIETIGTAIMRVQENL